MRLIFSSIFLVLMLSSCFVSKQVRLAKGGEVIQKNFETSIDFEYFKGLIYLPVIIEGNTYNFIYDSGAFMNVISVELAANLNLEEEITSSVKSSSGRKQQSGMVELPSAVIGGIEFKNTGTIIQDLDGLNSFLGCHAIDGIIGNNLMRKANWKIDYDNELILLSSTSDVFEHSESAVVIPLSNKKWGNKHLKVSINGIEEYYTFDTGFSGYIQNDLNFYKKLKNQDTLMNFATSKGLLSADLYGATFSETHMFLFDSLILGDAKAENQKMKLKENGSSLIGNIFFESYDLTMDWDNNQLILDPIKTLKNDTLRVFDVIIAPNYNTYSLEIKGEWKFDSEVNIKMGSKILTVNGMDVSAFSKEKLCKYWDIEWKDVVKEGAINITVLEDGIEKEYALKKRQLLPVVD